MKHILTLILTAFILTSAKADSTSAVKNYLSVEIDPAPFILGGYSFSLKYSPQKFNHLSVMASVYSSSFPDKMMNKTNYENGLRKLRIERSYAVFADYFIKPDRTGFHFGPSVFLYSKSVETDISNNRSSFNSIYPNLRVGYVLKPFCNSGFYINPWLNAGKEMIQGNKNTLYNPEKLSYIIALHIGYKINF